MSKFAPERVTINGVRHLSGDYYSLKMGPVSRIRKCRPGQFVHLGLSDRDVFFRRPMSIASVDTTSAEMEIIFKVCGRGTTMMTEYKRGDQISLLGPLGTGFTKPHKKEICLIVAGGVGFPPLSYLAGSLIENGRDPKSIEFFYGGRTADEIVQRSRFKKLGVQFHPATDAGSFGFNGLVTEALEAYLAVSPEQQYRLYACGPEPMLKATDQLALRHGIPGQLSLEAPMPCGIGVCLGCVVSLKNGGHARVCTEGPVFDIGEVAL